MRQGAIDASPPVTATESSSERLPRGRQHSAAVPSGTRRSVVILVSYMIGITAALKPKINAASWAALDAGKDKICGDATHRNVCMRQLKADETDALVSATSPVYLADAKEHPSVHRDLLASGRQVDVGRCPFSVSHVPWPLRAVCTVC